MPIDIPNTKIYIAIPCYGQQMLVPFVVSVFNLTHHLAKVGINHEIQIVGDSLIPRLRNTFAALFLESDCTHLLFLDCDIEFTSDAIVHMLDCDKDLIGSVYTHKEINWENVEEGVRKGLHGKDLKEVAGNMVATVDRDTEAQWDAPIEVQNVGTGLMLIKREVFEKLRDLRPELEYDVAENEPRWKPGKKAWDFFGCFLSTQNCFGKKLLLSEDYAFCERAHGVGYRTWALTCHRTVHWGLNGYVFNMPQLTALTMQPKMMLPKEATSEEYLNSSADARAEYEAKLAKEPADAAAANP